jgi:hypothetical protein
MAGMLLWRYAVKECAFCPETAELTAEHIIPQWMERLFPGKSNMKYKDGKGRISEWSSLKIDWKARVVCGPCNNGWMSDIESQHAMPVLTPFIVGEVRNIPITQGIARSLALFAFKTAVVMDHAHHRGKPWFSKRLRYAFREDQTISSEVQMWMCGTFGKRRAIDLHSGYFSGNLPLAYPVNSYVCTVAIGHLVFQVHNSKHFGKTRLYPLPIFDAVAVPFWPRLPMGVSWPFQANLEGKRDFDEFSMRWKSIAHDLPS